MVDMFSWTEKDTLLVAQHWQIYATASHDTEANRAYEEC